MDWNEEKAHRRQLRQAEKLARLMAAPAPRAEIVERDNQLPMNVATIAVGIEALELLLVEKGVLQPDELMPRMEKLVKDKTEAEMMPPPPPPPTLITTEID